MKGMAAAAAMALALAAAQAAPPATAPTRPARRTVRVLVAEKYENTERAPLEMPVEHLAWRMLAEAGLDVVPPSRQDADATVQVTITGKAIRAGYPGRWETQHYYTGAAIQGAIAIADGSKRAAGGFAGRVDPPARLGSWKPALPGQAPFQQALLASDFAMSFSRQVSTVTGVAQAVIIGGLVRHRQREYQEVGVAALGELGTPEARRELEGLLLKHREAWLRSHVADVLGGLKSPESVPALAAALKDGDASVRAHVARALAQIEHRSAVPALVAALSDSQENVRLLAVSALQQIGGNQAVKGLLVALGDGESAEVRKQAVLALGRLKVKAAATPLIGRLSDQDPSVRKAAVEVLAGMEAWEALDGIIERLAEDPSTEVRRAAFNALRAVTGTDMGEEADAWWEWLSRHPQKPKRE